MSVELLSEARATTVVTVTSSCFIPEEYLTASEEEIPQEALNMIMSQNGLPCDGGGVPGSWCERCYWGTSSEEDT